MIDPAALLLIDAQKGFHDPSWGNRNNIGGELRMADLLIGFRARTRPVLHVRHLSREPDSPLRPDQSGCEFLDNLEPRGQEPVFTKHVNSAFLGTGLVRHLRSARISSLVVAGFTTDHCVSTSVRMGANLGFRMTVAADATVAFDRLLPDGVVFSADLVHQVNLASLNREFAQVKDSVYILS